LEGDLTPGGIAFLAKPNAFIQTNKHRMQLTPTFGEHTVEQLTLMFQNRQIHLEPGFQRKSVWTVNDRRRLIQSV
jgi:hypothetical protein